MKSGEVTSFPQAVKLEPDETVVFAWIVYELREHRDRVNQQVMKDPRMTGMDPKAMPFDGKRMFWGGFKVLVAGLRGAPRPDYRRIKLRDLCKTIGEPLAPRPSSMLPERRGCGLPGAVRDEQSRTAPNVPWVTPLDGTLFRGGTWCICHPAVGRRNATGTATRTSSS